MPRTLRDFKRCHLGRLLGEDAWIYKPKETVKAFEVISPETQQQLAEIARKIIPDGPFTPHLRFCIFARAWQCRGNDYHINLGHYLTSPAGGPHEWVTAVATCLLSPPSVRDVFAEMANELGTKFPDQNSSPVETALFIGQCMEGWKPLYRKPAADEFTHLTKVDYHELTNFALDLLQTPYVNHPNSRSRLRNVSILKKVACFNPKGLSGWHDKVLGLGITWPGLLYHNAASSIVPLLISKHGTTLMPLGKCDVTNLLPWIPDAVLKSDSSANWRKIQEGVLPRHTIEAGWVPAGNDRRYLYWPTSFSLVPSAETQQIGKHAVAVGTIPDGQSGVDPESYRFLLDIDLQDARMAFLNIKGRRLRIPVSLRDPFGHHTYQLDTEGNAHFLSTEEEGYFGDEDGYPIEDTLVIGPARSTPFESVYGIRSEGRSQIGGFPGWEQDSHFPACPKCSKQMKFLAEMHGVDISYGDDVIYALICPECLTAATVSQSS